MLCLHLFMSGNGAIRMERMLALLDEMVEKVLVFCIQLTL